MRNSQGTRDNVYLEGGALVLRSLNSRALDEKPLGHVASEAEQDEDERWASASCRYRGVILGLAAVGVVSPLLGIPAVTIVITAQVVNGCLLPFLAFCIAPLGWSWAVWIPQSVLLAVCVPRVLSDKSALTFESNVQNKVTKQAFVIFNCFVERVVGEDKARRTRSDRKWR